MKTLAGMALGFSMMPVVFGVIAGYATLGIHFNLAKSDIFAGVMLGIATAVVGIVVAVKVWG